MAAATLDRLHVDDVLASIKNEGEQHARDAVLAFADGGEITPAELRETLLSADWSQDKFRAAFEVAGERREAVDDLDRSGELGARLPSLQGSIDELEKQIAAEEQAHRERMRPLRQQLDQAAGEFQAVRLESTSLRRDAMQVLNRTMDPEAKREHAELSNAAVIAQQRLQAASVKAHEIARRIEEAEALVKQADDKARHQQEHGFDPDDIDKAKRVAAKAKHDLRALHRIVGELTNAEAEHGAAREALQTWEREVFRDWRRMDFGGGRRGVIDSDCTRRPGESHSVA